jgi:hypothetical protein
MAKKRRKKAVGKSAKGLISKLAHLGASHKRTLKQLTAAGNALRAHQVKVREATKAIRASRKKTAKKRSRKR